MNYLDINLAEMNNEKIPVKFDMYFENSIFHKNGPDKKPDTDYKKPDIYRSLRENSL